jgi:peptide/nickel transport system substrate-binding protein
MPQRPGTKLFYMVLVLSIISALVMSCSSSPNASSPAAKAPVSSLANASAAPQYGGILIRPMTTSPTAAIGWPPEITNPATQFVDPALEWLVHEDANGVDQPWLATSWQVAPDRLSITFNLRKGVKFHDGTDWNAAAAKFNMDAYLEAKNSIASSWKSIDTIDDYTIRLNLNKWDMTSFTDSNLHFASPAAYQANGKDWMRTHIVGTGAYKFTSFTRDVSMVFEKFDGYWQKGKPYLNGIKFVIVPDKMSQQLAFETGDVHTTQLGGQQGVDLTTKGYPYVKSLASGQMALLPDGSNASSPWSKQKVREAAEYALDREAISKGVGLGFTVPAYQLAPQHPVGAIPNLEGRRYDPAKAKQLLAEAGYPNGFKTRVVPQPQSYNKDACLAIQRYWGEVGITTEIDVPDEGRYTDYRFKSGWDNGCIMTTLAVFSTYPKFFRFYFAGDQYKSIYWAPSFREAYNASMDTPAQDPEKCRVVSRLIYDNLMVIPVYINQDRTFYRDGVHDLGQYAWGDSPQWSPQDSWMEKKLIK